MSEVNKKCTKFPLEDVTKYDVWYCPNFSGRIVPGDSLCAHCIHTKEEE